MRSKTWRRAWQLLLIAIVAGVSGATTHATSVQAQNSLQVELFEDPFVCDAIVRSLGIVSGFAPGEPVEFASPQLNGVFSTRTADENGQVAMRWNCSSPETVSVTVRGLLSGSNATFDVRGTAAPPPPQAPLGSAFDAKTAMTTAQMATWKIHSPYNTVGIYIPVNSDWDNRADKIQSNLTPGWVSSVLGDGWRLIPIYVGWQAPDQCATARFEGLANDPAIARSQGSLAAADAVASVAQLGLGPGNPIYYDMEAYRPGCAEAVLAFLDAWTEGLQAAGYVSGVYGSRSSTMWDLSRAYNRDGFDPPDAVWVSTGNGNPTSLGLEIPTDGLWTNSRIHQYRLSVTRTYGGVTREVDENIVNAPLATLSAPSPAPVGDSDIDGDGFANPSPDNCDTIANPDQADLDADGDGDVCDSDIDGDGVANESDFAPRDNAVQLAPAPTAAPTPEAAEPTPEPTPADVDIDGDGFANPSPDNCDTIANPDQADLDGDGDGDVCDSDIDGDGVSNQADRDPRDPLVGALEPADPPVEPTPAPAEGTVTPPPDAEPSATPPTQDPTPAPDPEPTTAPALVVLPTPLALTPTPVASPTPPSEPAVDQAALLSEPPDADPDTPFEVATDTVTISVEDETSAVPYMVAALAAFSLMCVFMGVRSYRSGRLPNSVRI